MRRGRDEPGMVSAAEIASLVYGAGAWRREHGLGLPPGNRPALEAGDRYHARQERAERVAGGAIGLGRRLVVLAGLGLLLWWVLTR